MNNKEYGVKLNADISKYLDKLKTAKNYTEEVMEDIKDKIKEPLEEAGKTAKGGFTEKIEEMATLGEKVAELTLKYADVILIEGKQSKNAEDLRNKIRALNDEIERESGELGEVGQALDELFDNKKKILNLDDLFANLKKNINDLGNKVENSMQKGVRGIKRFSLSMLGIQSVYSMLSKAVRSYASLDTSMSKRIQANWIAIGAIFEPIVNFIIKGMQRLVGYINVFVKALTGGKVDLLSKAMKAVEKSTGKTTKAVKGLNKELSTLDEITNLNFDKGGADDEEFGLGDALNEIKDMDLNPEIVKKIKEVANYINDNIVPALKRIWDYIDTNILPILGFVYDKFVEWKVPLDNILPIITSIKYGLGVGLMTAVGLLILKIFELQEAWAKQSGSEEKLQQSRIDYIKNAKKRVEELKELLKDTNLTDEDRQKIEGDITEIIRQSKEEYSDFYEDMKRGKKTSEEQKEEMKGTTKELEKITNTKWKASIEQEVNVKLTQEGKNTLNELNRLASIFSALQGAFMLMGAGAMMPLSAILSPLVDALLNPGKSRGNSLGSLKFLHFDKGNVAYGPTVAEFGEYAGARSNPEITAPQNIIEETVVSALSKALPQINTGRGGDTVLYVNGKELARATYQDFKSEGNRLGSSSVAIRRVS